MYDIKKAAVIGAGTMGLGIAGQLANAGVDVLLLDIPADGENRNAHGERAIERLLDDKQPGLTHADNLARITIGNIEDDLDKLASVDWITEAIVEQLVLKKALYKKIDAVRKTGSIVSSNTSTIPIAGEDTKPDVIESLASFNEARMGKGIVICNDTPGFLGNRVGVFAIQTALHAALRLGLKPEEADAIFGRPMGIPKTGVFGLYDLIGIDLMSDVAKSLVSILPESDSFHDVSAEISLMQRMIEEGHLGNKGTLGGFYRSVDDSNDRQTLDFKSFSYRDFDESKPELAVAAELAADFTLLLESDDVYGRYAWEIISNTLCYAASLVPEVNESLVSVDDAMKLGYNWLQGPMEMIDAIGVDKFIARLESEGREVPAFVRTAGGKSFYRVQGAKLQYLLADGTYTNLERASGVTRFSEQRRTLKPILETRFSEQRRTLKPILENAVASYYELPEQIGLVEFHSKANTLDGESMALLSDAVEHASENLRGLIIHNDAAHFSCGVNLAAVLAFIRDADWEGLDRFLAHFQATVLAMRYSRVPVVAAPSGLSLGGGFEVLLHADKVVFHANSVTGLVESLVGVVPGGGGVKETLYRWTERQGDVTKGAWQAFMNIGYGKIARSPLEAQPLAMFREGIDSYVMNRDRLLDTAIGVVLEMADYSTERRQPLAMPGRKVWQEMIDWLKKAQSKGHLTPHDVTTGSQIAMIVTGGDVDAGTRMSENDICDLERAAFLTLAKTAETRARIEHMLDHGSPLRN